MAKMWRHKITSAGQVSIPAEVRERWETGTVLIVDQGDELVVRPTPDDPIEALRGAFPRKPSDRPSDVVLREWREEDIEAMDRKWKRHDDGG